MRLLHAAAIIFPYTIKFVSYLDPGLFEVGSINSVAFSGPLIQIQFIT